MNKNIIFLLRSYNRPEYLRKTLEYLEKSDLDDYCSEKYIYDDASDNIETLNILNNYKNKYNILYNTKNYKQKSFVKFMEYIETINTEKIDFICYLDNDALVTNDLLKRCIDTFELIKKERNKTNNEIIVSGFNTKKHPIAKIYNNYVLKKTIGGIHMFFHKSLLNSIKNWWDNPRGDWKYDYDWGVCHFFNKNGGEIYCLKPSVVQHIGFYGCWSNGNPDRSEIKI